MIGRSVRRVEDFRLLTGRGRFSDDRTLPDQLHAAFARSPHAHARLEAVETGEAERLPGVAAVLTAEDYAGDGMRPMPAQGNPKDVELVNRDGRPIVYPPLAPLADDRIRRVGEAVAMVVARTAAEALAGAEAVEVRYAPLPAAPDVRAALAPDAVRLWEAVPGNLCVDDYKGDAEAVEAAFARAAHVVRIETANNRVNGIPMEPRAALAAWDAAAGKLTLWAGGQGVNRFHRELCHVFGWPGERIRVVSEDVGGGYGTRNSLYPEFTLVAWAAWRLGRPVRWTATRSEAFLGDYDGRDLVTEAELALDGDGRFLAMRSTNTGNLGSHAVTFVPIARGPTVMTGLYDIPAAETVTKGVFTNSVPVTAYRGAGRPEATFMLERLIDKAARKTGIDRVALRERNLVGDLPYRNALGVVYDSGDFRRSQEMALRLSDWEGFEARRGEAAGRSRLRGIGLANYVETSTGWPVERAEMTVAEDGIVEVVIGTQSSGQGHETALPQIVSYLLDIPLERVRLVTGDTNRVEKGSGSHSTRTMRVGGHLLRQTADTIVAAARVRAAERLGAPEEELVFEEGRFGAPGRNESVGLLDLGPLRAVAEIETPLPAYPNGCHVAEVEIDPETGTVRVVRYTAVDDAGLIINPLLVNGQVHGGVTQGVGQALMECAAYDAAGQRIAGSFMDYAVPRADDLPFFEVAHNAIATGTNLLGAKGGGEGGTTPAPAAVANAVVDALGADGPDHIDMPITPEKVWRALRAMRRRPGLW